MSLTYNECKLKQTQLVVPKICLNFIIYFKFIIYFNFIVYFKVFFIAMLFDPIFMLSYASLNATKENISNLYLFNYMLMSLSNTACLFKQTKLVKPKIYFNFIVYFNVFHISILKINQNTYFLTYILFYRR